MARAPRVVEPGAHYHVFARGNRRRTIFVDDHDYALFLRLLEDVVLRHAWVCLAYCLMPNHFHFAIQLLDRNLSKGMQALNGRYAQLFNERHASTGHLFQGRFGARLVESEERLLELTRYVALNPVRAALVAHPSDWRWSSHRAAIGRCPSPPFLARERLLDFFGGDPSVYATFVREAMPT